MDFFETVAKRRSVRKYTSKVVPEEVVKKALAAAIRAPNSSNMQAWEFYWVKSPEKKSRLVDACLAQGAAKTASHLVVAVSRIDTWRRNRDFIVAEFKKSGAENKTALDYYNKLVPLMYFHDPLGVVAFLRWVIFNVSGWFKPTPRGPAFKSQLFEVVTKSAALACENFMLAIAAQGYGSCPMEGFDESRVKSLLGLNSKCHVVMVMSVGEVDSAGIWGAQFRVDDGLIIHEV